MGFRAWVCGAARRRHGTCSNLPRSDARARSKSSDAVFKFHTAKVLLGTLAAILDGEIHRTSGDMKGAIAAFERAVSLDDSIVIDDPEPLPLPARHWLGAALLDAKRFADAERVYREDLDSIRTTAGRWLACNWRSRDKGSLRQTLMPIFAASWARADTPIKASRF